jgi:NAD-dependent SIR2 family protein deacetylase
VTEGLFTRPSILSPCGTSLKVTPWAGIPTLPGCGCRSVHISAKGPVSVEPKPVQSSTPPGTMPAATRVMRSQTGWLIPAPAYMSMETRAKKVSRRAPSVSIASSSIW